MINIISTTLQTSSWSASERLVDWALRRIVCSSPDEDDGVVAGIWDATGAVPAFSQREAVCFSWWEERESWLKYHVLGFRSKKNNERLRGTFSIVIDRLLCPFCPPFGGSWAQDEFVFIVLLRQTLIVLLKSKIDKRPEPATNLISLLPSSQQHYYHREARWCLVGWKETRPQGSLLQPWQKRWGSFWTEEDFYYLWWWWALFWSRQVAKFENWNLWWCLCKYPCCVGTVGWKDVL